MMTVESTELSKILSSQPMSRPKFVFRANVVFHVSQLLRAAERTLKTPDDEPRVNTETDCTEDVRNPFELAVRQSPFYGVTRHQHAHC
jgi:hypothetical protein